MEDRSQAAVDARALAAEVGRLMSGLVSSTKKRPARKSRGIGIGGGFSNL
jgi:hypothetical protein